MKHYGLGLLSIGLAASFSFQANAQQQPVPQGWSVGVGAVVQQLGYRGGDTQSGVFPLLAYEGEDMYWRGPEIGYQVSDELTLIASYRLNGYENDDSDFLTGMEERKGTVELGFAYNIEVGRGQLGFTGMADVLDNHEGYIIGANYSLPYSLWGGMVAPFAQVSYQSQDFVDYYYGVRNTEATAVRAAYKGDNTVNYGFGVMGMFPLTENQTLIANLSHEFFGSEIEDSPIVEDSGATSLLLIWAYSF